MSTFIRIYCKATQAKYICSEYQEYLIDYKLIRSKLGRLAKLNEFFVFHLNEA